MKIITNLKKAIRELPKKGQHNMTKILCLGVGLAVGSVLIAKVYFEQTYDTFYPHAKQLYQVNEVLDRNNEHKDYPNTSGGIAPALKKYAPQIVAATRFTYIGDDKSIIETDDKKRFSTNSIVLADSCLFDVLYRPVIVGDIKETLTRENYCAIPKSLADAIGGDMMGKKIKMPTIGNSEATVGCIYEDFPENSQFRSLGVIISLNSITEYMWDGRNNFVGNDRYASVILLADGTTPENIKDAVDKMIKENLPLDELKKAGVNLSYSFTQLSEVYTSKDSVKRMAWILSLLAFILLFSVTMNYLLIVIGQMVGRAREMAIHKCFGAENSNIYGMVFMESMVHILISVVIAAMLIFLCKGTISDILNASVSSLLFNKGSWILIAVCLFMLFITGVIPGWLYSRIPVASAFRGYKENKRRWKLLLLAIQFTAAGFLLCLLILIGRQYSRMVNDDPGYKYENLAIVSIDGTKRSERTNAINELERLGCVESVTSSYMLLADEFQSGDNVSLPGKDEELFNACDLYLCGKGYMKTLEIPIIQGSNFNEDADSTLHEVMVDRKFVEKMKATAGWDDNIIGRSVDITGHEVKTFTICGVFENVRIKSITNPETRPAMLFYGNTGWSNILVKFHNLDADGMQEVTEKLESMFPDKNITIKAYRNEMIDLYQDSHRFRNAVLIGGLVTLIIALIGLIGYTNDEISRRHKEIAIRKVNGAEVKDILSIFMKDIIRIALPSLIVGGLGAAFIAGKWLEQFSEKVPLNPLAFIGCGAVLLVIILVAVNMNCYKVANSNPVNYLKGE